MGQMKPQASGRSFRTVVVRISVKKAPLCIHLMVKSGILKIEDIQLSGCSFYLMRQLISKKILLKSGCLTDLK